ncbi:MAG: 1-acyl-sn-glycerol-3-phosphate acyltransferase [Bacteroidales bacterium]|jgi:1-acyl-sn-glycerol-3-phosphate acyltransferase|nr:1-acyl-sn-glycerol-3-phosphate acyltransferase [Bacteroidales bacterium]
MISFEHINKPNIKYTLLYHYIRFVHNYIYYQRYYVLHRKRIPRNAPVIAISNHQNGLTDALGILFAFTKDGRYPIFIARADIFKHKIAAILLRWLRIMPAFRSVDVGKAGLDGNDAIFNKSAEILTENGVICLFPEAGHEDCHHLGTFKKGFARIAFNAEEMLHFAKPVYILPMSNHYSDYFGVQNKLIITVGDPFTFEDLYDIYKTHPQRAQKLLTDRAREKVKALMLDIENKKLYEEYDTLRTMYDKQYARKIGQSTRWFPNVFEADKKIIAAIDSLRKQDPDKFQALMTQAKEYSHLLDKLHLRDWIFRQKFSFGTFLLRCLWAILLIPFIVYGFINNVIPFNTSTLVTRRIKDQMLHSSFHFVIGVLFAFPIWYLFLFFTVWFFTGVWYIAAGYLVSLPLSLIIYIHSKIIVKKQFYRFNRFRLWFRGNRFYRRAVELRQEIIRTMDDFVE